MSLGWYAVILAVIAAVAIPVTLAIDGHRDRRRFDAEIAAAEGRLEANRAGRHRMSQPQIMLTEDGIKFSDGVTIGSGVSIAQSTGADGKRVVEFRGNRPPNQGWTDPPANGDDPQPPAPRPPGRHQPSMSGQYVPRSHVSAADIGPVWWTEPGRPQAAPSKHGAPDTGRMPRIRLEDASTGGIRKLTDDVIAELERAGAVDRAMIERGESLT